MVVFTFCCRLLVVCLTRGEASASEKRSVPKQQTGSGGYRFVGSSGLSPRKICIEYRTGLYLSRKSQVHAGQFRGPYSTSPALSCTLQPFSTNPIHSSPHTISLPYKGLPLPLGNFHCSHGVFPLQCLFGPFSKSLSAPLLAAFGWPHTFTLSRCIHLGWLHALRLRTSPAATSIPYTLPSALFSSAPRTTALSSLSPSPWPPSLAPRTAVFITGPPGTDRD